MACPYILKFNGIFYHNDVPAIVTPWVPHGSITKYLEKHIGVDRLQLVRLSVPPVLSVLHSASCRSVAFGCGRRSQVSSRDWHSAWGHQSGKPPDSCGGSDHPTITSSVKHARSELYSAPSHTRRLLFRPRRGHLRGVVKRRTRHAVLHGS